MVGNAAPISEIQVAAPIENVRVRAVTLFSRGGNFSRTISECILLPLPRALLTEFYTTNLSVAAFPFEPPEPQRVAAQRTHEWAEGRKRRWSMEGEATGLGRAEGGSAGGGGVRHVPLQVACPYAEKEGVTVGS